MYRYDAIDQRLVDERAAQFREQVRRRMAGELSDLEFKPLRLMNGLYLQLHAYMLRIAVPYGTLSSKQLRALASIGRKYDKDYGHFTTRQNLQFNWIKLEDAPDILDDLAAVEMHAIQTSGNCVRNVTADQYAGVAAGEIEDPRIYAEIIRQWSSLHPEFSFLPRKFKIAVTAASPDRAAVKTHDVGLFMKRNEKGEIGFQVFAGGGQGRTPMMAQLVRDFVPKAELLAFIESVIRVYNLMGRRDNIHKARIKILVHALGIDKFRELIDADFAATRDSGSPMPAAEIARVAAYFMPPAYERIETPVRAFEAARFEDRDFARWVTHNVVAHKQPGYAIAVISLKPTGGIPGDATSDQMDRIADFADRYSIGEIRVTHEQNLVLPNVKQADLHALWRGLGKEGLATPNLGLITDIIACPGLDYCALANARSIPIAQRIQERFADPDRQALIGELKIKISGCINACGHHHVGHIGILGVDKQGEEFYQITLGGSADENATVGKILGKGFPAEQVPDAIENLVDTYLGLRADGELFLDTYRRVGIEPFKERVYAAG
ncbi:MAG: nitrite/sulfite reductase [Dongiaceae bacterium]